VAYNNDSGDSEEEGRMPSCNISTNVPSPEQIKIGDVRRRGAFRHIGRLRYQLLVLVSVSVVIPFVVRQFAFYVPSYATTQIATIIGGAIAVLLGYFAYRRLLIFPGIAGGGYVITSMTATFGVLAAVFLMMRVDYSRGQLIGCYVLSISTLLLIHLKVERHRNFVFACVPGGRTDRLPDIANVHWHRIAKPSEPMLGRVDSIVVDLHHVHDAEWESAVTRWVLDGVPVLDTRIALEQLTGQVEINHISENTLGSLNPNAVLLKLKSIADFCISVLTILLLAPVFLLIAVLIRLDSPGPAIFRQQRMGFRARPFTVFKFRTMHHATSNLSHEQAREQAMTRNDDARITRFGRILRRSRLDELPQLFNIVRGEMSLIGPRPEAVSLSRWYEAEIPFYHYRHIIKPGLSGWAQVNQGHVTEVEHIRKKLNLDFYYVKNYSAWLDVLIALRTIAIMVTGHGAR
jgi:lipopolysaccharide/colanic/teichoic acid biosynthesis glycosyltransferase